MQKLHILVINSTRSRVYSRCPPTLARPVNSLATMPISLPADSSPSTAAVFPLAQRCARASRAATRCNTVRTLAFSTRSQSPGSLPRMRDRHTHSTTRHAPFQALRQRSASANLHPSLRHKQYIPRNTLARPQPQRHCLAPR